ncbi:DUF1259 domain-containing protein [Bacillus pseudomycoides]|uniref:DUF1259 domain-containing protein n=1 Tax=Bacillus pseudomycoides TaxID=64104 RepID=UPI002B45A45B|nr:DUF1259 domain-containing protein [Bacillus pseudomycoides]MEB3057481.1 DUF1259 domain-containing protein [Bacillus pseudomycoides]
MGIEKVQEDPTFEELCGRFFDALGGTEHSIEPGPVCVVTRTRIFDETILGRKSNSPLVNYQFFSFESLDASGKALCLGETVAFQNQVEQVLSNLRDRGIIVSGLHNHWMNENPRLFYIHWESIDDPIAFARKSRESIDFLGPVLPPDLPPVEVTPEFKELCDAFTTLLGGEEGEIEPGPVCFVMRPVNFEATILGRTTNSPLVSHQLFSFESLDSTEVALCLGETATNQEQTNQLISSLLTFGFKVTAFHNHWLEDNPHLIYVHWESIEDPLAFARKSKRAIEFLG